MVYRGRSALGPFEYRNNINRRGATPGVHDAADAAAIIVPAQLTDIAPIHAADGVEFIWMG